MRRSSALGAFIAAIALVASAIPAAADVRDIDLPFDLPFFPCLAGPHPPSSLPPTPGPGANDGAFPHICFVNIGQSRPWQASTGEWILFRAVRGPFGSQAECDAASYTATAEVQGAAEEVDIACLEVPPNPFFPPNTWFKSFRVLSHPLPAGTDTATLTLTPAAGPAETLTATVSID